MICFLVSLFMLVFIQCRDSAVIKGLYMTEQQNSMFVEFMWIKGFFCRSDFFSTHVMALKKWLVINNVHILLQYLDKNLGTKMLSVTASVFVCFHVLGYNLHFFSNHYWIEFFLM